MKAETANTGPAEYDGILPADTQALDCLWVGGWALDPDAGLQIVTEAFPGRRHQWWLPDPENFHDRLTQLLRHRTVCLCGYSLGAHLLLEALAKGLEWAGPVWLYAPFIDLRVESGLGGRVASAQIQFLRRWLQRDRLGAIADFYQRAGLSLQPPPIAAYPDSALCRGLDMLLQPGLHAWPDLPEACRVIVGAADPLIDSDKLASPAHNTRVIPAAGHDLPSLLCLTS